jgi:hypothetical protein
MARKMWRGTESMAARAKNAYTVPAAAQVFVPSPTQDIGDIRSPASLYSPRLGPTKRKITHNTSRPMADA